MRQSILLSAILHNLATRMPPSDGIAEDLLAWGIFTGNERKAVLELEARQLLKEIHAAAQTQNAGLSSRDMNEMWGKYQILKKLLEAHRPAAAAANGQQAVRMQKQPAAAGKT